MRLNFSNLASVALTLSLAPVLQAAPHAHGGSGHHHGTHHHATHHHATHHHANHHHHKYAHHHSGNSKIYFARHAHRFSNGFYFDQRSPFWGTRIWNSRFGTWTYLDPETVVYYYWYAPD